MIKGIAKDIAISAMTAALLVCGKLVISFIPNVEVVTPLIIITTCAFGYKRVLPAVLVFCLLDNFLYTFYYIVTIQYFIHWPLLCVLSEVTFRIFRENSLAFAFLALVSALLFWVETPALHHIFKVTLFLPTLISGIPFMLPMAIGGFIFTLLAYRPLYGVLTRHVLGGLGRKR